MIFSLAGNIKVKLKSVEVHIFEGIYEKCKRNVETKCSLERNMPNSGPKQKNYGFQCKIHWKESS